MSREAILIHGTASSPADTWERTGWPYLLEDLGIAPVMVSLPGHIGSLLPADALLDDAVGAVLSAAPAADILIGFSAGAALALHAALAAPQRITTLVLLGIGDGFWGEPAVKRDIAERLRSGEDDAFTRLMRGMVSAAGNDLGSISRYIETAPGPPPLATVGSIAARTLLVCGADDAAGPATTIAEALPRATVVEPIGVDHVRTTSAPATMAAVARFLGSGLRRAEG